MSINNNVFLVCLQYIMLPIITFSITGASALSSELQRRIHIRSPTYELRGRSGRKWLRVADKIHNRWPREDTIE